MRVNRGDLLPSRQLQEQMVLWHEAERSLQDRLMQLASAAESACEPTFGADTAGRCTFCNTACLQLFGQEAADVVGQRICQVIRHRRADGTPCSRTEECALCGVRHGNLEPKSGQEIFWRVDGTSFLADYHSYAVESGGQRIGTSVTLTNISDSTLVRTRVGHAGEPLIALHLGSFADGSGQRVLDAARGASETEAGSAMGDREPALRVDNPRILELIESLPLLVWTCLPDGRCDYLSPQWVGYTGIPADQQLGMRWLD